MSTSITVDELVLAADASAPFVGEQGWIVDGALPQVAFHQMIAYAILRHAGVPLGKVDYVPHMFGYLRPGTLSQA